MNNPYILLPVIFQLVTAIFMMFFWGKTTIHKISSIFSGLLNLGIAIWLFRLVWSQGIQVMHAGGWEAPFGITFVVDVFSAVMVLLTALSGIAVSIFSTGSIRNKLSKFGYFPILHFLLMGLNGAFLTGD